MKFSEYSEKAASTQLEQSKSLEYLALGLCGEVVEFLQSDPENLKYEAGDIVWYVDRYADAIGCNLEQIIYPHETKQFSQGERSFCSKAPIQQKRATSIKSTSDSIIHSVGELAELTKKYIRDGSLKTTEAKKCLFEIYTNLVSFLSERSVTIEEVAQLNINKLISRKNRGVIQGSGDHR